MPPSNSKKVIHPALDALADPTVRQWFRKRFGAPTPPQAAAWPALQSGQNVLIVSPTGTGKTLAAFLPILATLAAEHRAQSLLPRIHALYLSPLRALGYDLAKNLQTPLLEIFGPSPPLRIALRTGDTPAAEREKQFSHPPHLLLSTPESLCLLLSQEKWLPRLQNIRWIIVDEIHALAENKRGAHLAVSLERIADLCRRAPAEPTPSPAPAPASTPPPPPAPPKAPLRIGLSATVAPLLEVARFLTGPNEPCQIIDVSNIKKIDLQVYSPLQRNPYPQAGFTGVRLMSELARLIQKQKTTLIFTNTRSGAESATHWLKQQLPNFAPVIECHHASLDREVRLEIEDRLKTGRLRAVVCSTSLEMGLDLGCVDLVVMLATPKGVSRALQRAGRAGHSIHQISRGLLMATNITDLIECCATARLARAGHLDSLHFPAAPLDVLAQHLMSMACVGEWNLDAAFDLIRRSHPYQSLSRNDFQRVLEFLAGGGRSLQKQYTETFGKIVLSDQTFAARSTRSRRDFLENVGTIPADTLVRVLLGRTPLGVVEEAFARNLRPGTVFVLAGRVVRVTRLENLECHVAAADGATPTIPRWGASKFSLSNRVAREIRSFRRELRSRIESMRFEESPSLIPWVASRLECSADNAAAIFRIHAAQHQFSEIPTADFLLVEDFLEVPDPSPATARRSHSPTEPQRHYFIHSLIGRSANDAFARVLALRLSRSQGGNAIVTSNDYGFVLTVHPSTHLSPELLRPLLAPEQFESDLHHALEQSDLVQYHFRNAAQTGLMIYRNFFGQQKSVRKLQWSAEVLFKVLLQHEPDHVLLEEARRDARFSQADGDRALAYLNDFHQNARPVRVRSVPSVPPLSFSLYATKIKEALSVEDPTETLERLYQLWWNKLNPTPDHSPA